MPKEDKKVTTRVTVSIDYLNLKKDWKSDDYVEEERIHEVETDCTKQGEYNEAAIASIIRRTTSDTIKCPGCDKGCSLKKDIDTSRYLDHGDERDTRILRRMLVYVQNS